MRYEFHQEVSQFAVDINKLIVTYREFIKRLKQEKGAVLVNTKGKHNTYKLSDKRMVNINVHSGEVPKGYEKYLK